MSARLKLKRINDRILGVMKMAQKAQYDRDEIHLRDIRGCRDRLTEIDEAEKVEKLIKEKDTP